MSSPLVALVARIAAGEQLNVSAEAAALGTSRQQVYRYLRRYRDEGPEGFLPRSRRPLDHPRTTAALVEDAVVAARKRLTELGLDVGATSIGYWLEDNPEALVDVDGVIAVIPARATINRILARRGHLTPVPARRPHRALRRFVRPAINDLWQLDGYETQLLVGHGVRARAGQPGKVRTKTTTAIVIDILDDHSRRLLASHAAAGESAGAVWAAFEAAAETAGGLPRQLLTDNAAALNGSRRGFTAGLEAAVTALGVEPISTSVGRPQTNGKVERVHATLQRWLAARDTPTDLNALQELLDEGREYYNFSRRHQALAGRTPAQVWNTALQEHRVCGPASATPELLHVTTPTVGPRGGIGVDGLEVTLGRAHIGAAVTVFRSGDHITVFINGRYDHARALDRSTRGQRQHRSP